MAEVYWDLEWTMLQQGFDYGRPRLVVVLHEAELVLIVDAGKQMLAHGSGATVAQAIVGVFACTAATAAVHLVLHVPFRQVLLQAVESKPETVTPEWWAKWREEIHNKAKPCPAPGARRV